MNAFRVLKLFEPVLEACMVKPPVPFFLAKTSLVSSSARRNWNFWPSTTTPDAWKVEKFFELTQPAIAEASVWEIFRAWKYSKIIIIHYYSVTFEKLIWEQHRSFQSRFVTRKVGIERNCRHISSLMELHCCSQECQCTFQQNRSKMPRVRLQHTIWQHAVIYEVRTNIIEKVF